MTGALSSELVLPFPSLNVPVQVPGASARWATGCGVLVIPGVRVTVPEKSQLPSNVAGLGGSGAGSGSGAGCVDACLRLCFFCGLCLCPCFCSALDVAECPLT